jgi:hypothetical protein
MDEEQELHAACRKLSDEEIVEVDPIDIIIKDGEQVCVTDIPEIAADIERRKGEAIRAELQRVLPL